MSIFDVFKKKPQDEPRNDGIVVIKKTEPGTCGGTDAILDKNLPREITCDEMTLLNVTSELGYGSEDRKTEPEDRLCYISAFAVKAQNGFFLFLETRSDPYEQAAAEWGLVKHDVFPALAAIVKKHDYVKNNGYHSQTHGLPKDFGGRVTINYANGEKISFSNNQTPIISRASAIEIAAAMRSALKGERVALPDISRLCAVRFSHERGNGGFTRAELSLRQNGTAINKKESRYDNPTVYESEKEVSAETVGKIKRIISECGMLAWEGLPDDGYRYGGDKTLCFVFPDGSVTVKNDRLLPDRIGRGFFNIELEMATKN